MTQKFKNAFSNVQEDDTIVLGSPKQIFPSESLTERGFNPTQIQIKDNSLVGDQEIKITTSISSNDAFPKPVQQDAEPPLLEDIGIDIGQIKERILLVCTLSQPSSSMLSDPDLSGPVTIALTLGFLLLFAGKVHFGDIYAVFVIGNIISYVLINLTSKSQIIPLYNVMSILGYGLLPMLILGILGVFFTLDRTIGLLITFGLASWSAVGAGSMVNIIQNQSVSNKFIAVYPLFLFYLSFAMIVLF